MDAATTSTRKFPGFTTDDLKVAVMDYRMGIHPCGVAPDGLVEAMIAEVLRREAGTSKPMKTPQAAWAGMKPVTIIGRM